RAGSGRTRPCRPWHRSRRRGRDRADSRLGPGSSLAPRRSPVADRRAGCCSSPTSVAMPGTVAHGPNTRPSRCSWPRPRRSTPPTSRSRSALPARALPRGGCAAPPFVRAPRTREALRRSAIAAGESPYGPPPVARVREVRPVTEARASLALPPLAPPFLRGLASPLLQALAAALAPSPELALSFRRHAAHV